MAMPTANAVSVARIDQNNTVRVPQISRERMSRPIMSVPSRKRRPSPSGVIGVSSGVKLSRGSWGASHGANSAISTQPPTNNKDRKSVLEGKSVSVRRDIGGRRSSKKKKEHKHT